MVSSEACGRPAGFTLLELLTALVVLGILASLAVPPTGRWIERTRMSSVLDRLRDDVFYTRMLAVRAGRRAEVQFSSDPNGCITEYRVVVRTEPAERVSKRVEIAEAGGRMCLQMNNTGPLVFNSRGLPSPVTNRSWWIRQGAMVDSVIMSSAGRLRSGS